MKKKNDLRINDVEESSIVIYLNYNDFKKKMSALRTYCIRAYKDLIFNVDFKKLCHKSNGMYSLDLETSKEFKYVYGQIKLIYYVKDGKVYIDNLIPDDFLLCGYLKLLNTYKGMPYRDERDLFKINLLVITKSLEKRK